MTPASAPSRRAAAPAGRRAATAPLIVTIDGPAGAGKSSVSRLAAAALGLEFLDTGAMYRAAAALTLDHGVSADDERAVADLVRLADLRFDFGADPPDLLAFGRSIMGRLRAPDVSALVSPISALPALRAVMVDLQRRIGLRHPRLVTEGRDQGSVVFPGAGVKIYLDASPVERARRRAEHRGKSGADVASIAREIRERDRRDSTRAVGPLVRPPDAVLLDTSGMTFDEVVNAIVRSVRERAGGALGAGSDGG